VALVICLHLEPPIGMFHSILALCGHCRHERWKSMSNRLLSFISAVIVSGSAAVAAAQAGSIWSAAGVTGIVDEADLTIHSFNSTGSVAIKSSVASGTLDIRYPVQTVPDLLVPQQGDCPEMRVNLRDTGPGARVIVRLMALSIFPGSGTQVTSIAEIDSDRSQPPLGDPNEYHSYRTCLDNVPPGSEFLFDKAFFTYYVEAQLIKTTATANPGLMSLQICPSQDACDP